MRDSILFIISACKVEDMIQFPFDALHSVRCEEHHMVPLSSIFTTARLAQSVERKALNLVVVGSSPTVGALQITGLFHDTSNIKV